MSKIKLAGKSISEILKRIKRAQRNKRATQNQEKAGLSTKSIKPWNYRAGARNEQIVPVKKQSQTGSSFQPHKVRGKQGAASIKETSEGSAASWRDEMDKYFGDLTPSKFFKKASGGDINTGMKKLSPKQKAIAAKAPPPDKIDAKDFAVLKAEKAKGRGMGLQDESVKPGKVQKAFLGALMLGKKMKDEGKAMPLGFGAAFYKNKKMKEMLGRRSGGVMKANKGKAIKADPTKPISSVAPKVTDVLKKKKLPGRIGTALGIGAMMVPAAYAAAKQYKDYKSAKNRDEAKVKKYSVGGGADSGKGRYSSMAEMRAAKGFKSGETPSQFNKRRMMLEGAKKAAKATRIGKIAAGIGAVGVAASQFLKKKMEEKKENKKMVGGMAKKYSVGGGADMGKKNKKSKSGSSVKDIFKSYGKYDGKPIELSKGGGADTGTAGETKSRRAVASDRLKRRLNTAIERRRRLGRELGPIGGFGGIPSPKRTPGAGPERLSRQDIVFTTDKSFLKDMKPPSGAAPGKFKSGTMVKARGCKLGRTRPTKIT